MLVDSHPQLVIKERVPSIDAVITYADVQRIHIAFNAFGKNVGPGITDSTVNRDDVQG